MDLKVEFKLCNQIDLKKELFFNLMSLAEKNSLLNKKNALNKSLLGKQPCFSAIYAHYYCNIYDLPIRLSIIDHQSGAVKMRNNLNVHLIFAVSLLLLI